MIRIEIKDEQGNIIDHRIILETWGELSIYCEKIIEGGFMV